jgi:MarR-like DNA-binding transcriptional regulator SgrR of sgrS sRNA
MAGNVTGRRFLAIHWYPPHSWEITEDGKTYTFMLRKGVQFHDGAELTSADFKATFDRISKRRRG